MASSFSALFTASKLHSRMKASDQQLEMGVSKWDSAAALFGNYKLTQPKITMHTHVTK
jgi:hypothetical protein